ncbi:MAG: chemotaxis protein [Hyphomicrobiales bacterium]|nr:MAG: chemotaxis protein [Hyphomicrobiales bacterium]
MFGLSMGLFIEAAVAVLMALTLGYCVILNQRLVRLHADREALKLMVGDLVAATNLANQAIRELKATAVEADMTLSSRLEEAERFGIELANHINSGAAMMQRIVRLTNVARQHPVLAPVPTEVEDTMASGRQPNKVRAALEQLSTRVSNRGVAA